MFAIIILHLKKKTLKIKFLCWGSGDLGKYLNLSVAVISGHLLPWQEEVSSTHPWSHILSSRNLEMGLRHYSLLRVNLWKGVCKLLGTLIQPSYFVDSA